MVLQLSTDPNPSPYSNCCVKAPNHFCCLEKEKKNKTQVFLFFFLPPPLVPSSVLWLCPQAAAGWEGMRCPGCCPGPLLSFNFHHVNQTENRLYVLLGNDPFSKPHCWAGNPSRSMGERLWGRWVPAQPGSGDTATPVLPSPKNGSHGLQGPLQPRCQPGTTEGFPLPSLPALPDLAFPNQ